MSGPSTPSRSKRRERRGDLHVQVVAALRRVGGRLEIEITLGRQLPGRSDILVQIFETSRFRDHGRQIVEPLGQFLDRTRIVDQRRRNLIGGGLPLVAGLGLVADPELLDVDPQLPVGPLADPVGERRPGTVNDGRAHHHGTPAERAAILATRPATARWFRATRPVLDHTRSRSGPRQRGSARTRQFRDGLTAISS